MEIYIKDMEMPKSCSDCPMLDWDLDYIKCKVTWRHFKVKEEPFGARRVDDCPLISVPEPHGDLIDRNVLREVVKKHATPSDAWVFSLIRTAPTVIPASEEDE